MIWKVHVKSKSLVHQYASMQVSLGSIFRKIAHHVLTWSVNFFVCAHLRTKEKLNQYYDESAPSIIIVNKCPFKIFEEVIWAQVILNILGALMRSLLQKWLIKFMIWCWMVEDWKHKTANAVGISNEWVQIFCINI